jgi:hypothetical protein
MPNTLLHYNLTDDYLQNWLVAGPLALPVDVPEPPPPPEVLARTAVRLLTEPASGVTEPPVDLGPLGDQPDLTWRYYRCRDDHFVDLTQAQPSYTYLRAWAYAQVTLPAAQSVQLVLTTYGPADVWVNGQALPRVEHFEPRPRSVTLPVELQAGFNELLVRFETAGAGDVPFVMALRLVGAT